MLPWHNVLHFLHIFILLSYLKWQKFIFYINNLWNEARHSKLDQRAEFFPCSEAALLHCLHCQFSSDQLSWGPSPSQSDSCSINIFSHHHFIIITWSITDFSYSCSALILNHLFTPLPPVSGLWSAEWGWYSYSPHNLTNNLFITW